MRIRKKKHLEERLLKLNNYLLNVDTSIKNVNEALSKKDYLDLNSIFNNANPLCIEVGCGKGGFILNMSKKHPEYNYIAVEMMQNIIVMAVESVIKEGLSNVRFINTGAEYLPRYIKEGTVEKIFLNFSPPYPKKTYECRRLTNKRFVESYYSLLKDGGVVEQKTDDYEFFIYSKESFISNGFKVEDKTETLPYDTDNIVTEYESKFRKQGMPIYKLVATKNK